MRVGSKCLGDKGVGKGSVPGHWEIYLKYILYLQENGLV